MMGVVIGFLLGLFAGLSAPLALEYLKLRVAGPVIEMEFLWKRPYVIKTAKGLGAAKEFHPVYLFRLGISNRSEHLSARNCVVMLTGVWHRKGRQFKAAENFEPVRLEWLSHMPVDISPGMRVIVPFGRVTQANGQGTSKASLHSGDLNTPEFRFRAPHWPSWFDSRLAPGTHRFRITAYFDNMPPVQELFELVWLGKWTDDYHKMSRHAKIVKKD